MSIKFLVWSVWKASKGLIYVSLESKENSVLMGN